MIRPHFLARIVGSTRFGERDYRQDHRAEVLPPQIGALPCATSRPAQVKVGSAMIRAPSQKSKNSTVARQTATISLLPGL